MKRLQEQAGRQGQEGGEGPESEARREQPGQTGQEGGQDGGGQRMTAEEMRRAAEALRKMAQGGQGRQQMRAAQGRMIDVREMLRRGQAGQAGKGGQGGQAGGESRDGQEPGGEGAEAARRFEEGARGGGEGEGEPLGLGGEPGEKGSGDMLLLGGDKQGPGSKLAGKGQGGGQPQVGTDGIGQGHDKRLLGDKTALDVETQEDFVAGQHGDGDSRSKVVMTAAQKGFASRAYREVHQDYAEVVEDALEKEHIPPGKRTYVRKYFDLIRPR
jgi:hypothetical protein